MPEESNFNMHDFLTHDSTHLSVFWYLTPEIVATSLGKVQNKMWEVF